MFENVLGQLAADQLKADIEASAIAPAMLFHGPPASGKGTAALELGRFLSCEAEAGAESGAGRAHWNCGCSACFRHRLLVHPDLLCMGPKPFSAEITASSEAFLREASVPKENRGAQARILFIRSVRKLLCRFNPVLWEDEPKGSKIFPLVNSLEEDLDELDFYDERNSADAGPPLKLVEGILKTAYKLESEGIGETIPIGQLRRAAYWSRLAPSGRYKLLIIENTDRMQEEARNSLLKLLEEPPARVYCVLTSSRPGSLTPTMLSRLRPYRFYSRDPGMESEVIRRVFRDESGAVNINTYLDSFLPVSPAVLEGLAAFFTASVAYKAALLSKKQGRPLPPAVVLLGKYSAPLAEAAGFGRPGTEAGAVISRIVEKAENFEIRSLFSRFLSCVLDQVSVSQMNSGAGADGAASYFLSGPLYNEMWKNCINWAGSAALVYKLRPAQVLEKLFNDLSMGMADL